MKRKRNKFIEAQAVIKYDNLPMVRFIPHLLTQLFEILIDNAIKYQGDSPAVIKITAKKEENSFLFAVEDNGIGIPDTHYERIFMMFQRLQRHDEIAGTGAGLSLARKIVELHGGRIWVESTPGKGSCFYFTVPIHPIQTA